MMPRSSRGIRRAKPRVLVDMVGSSDLGGMGISSTGYYTGATRYLFRTKFRNRGKALINPRFAFPTFYLSNSAGYTANPTTFTVAAALEYGGVNWPITFSAASSLLLESSPWYYCDALPMTMLPDSDGFLRVLVTCQTTDRVPAGRQRYPSANTVEQAIVGGTNSLVSGTGAMTLVGAGSGSAFSLYQYAPVYAVSGQERASIKTFAIIGDSIADGFSYDTNYDARGNYGWAARGCAAAGYNFVKLSRGSNRSQWSTPSAAPGQFTPLPFCNYLVHGLGTNDFNGGRSLASVQSDSLAIWADATAAGSDIIAVRLLPRTNASNVPISTAFDPAGTNLRGGYHTWLDAKLADDTIQHIFDPSPNFELGSTGTWSSYATQTVEGTHLLPSPYDTVVNQFAAFATALP